MNRWRGQLRRLRATANSCINQQTACSQAAHEEICSSLTMSGAASSPRVRTPSPWSN